MQPHAIHRTVEEKEYVCVNARCGPQSALVLYDGVNQMKFRRRGLLGVANSIGDGALSCPEKAKKNDDSTESFALFEDLLE